MQKILIVDDQEINLDYMSRHLLNLFECEVESFLDPLEAFGWAKENDFDLAMIDYRMPGISGVDLVRKIRTLTRHQTVPLIIITSDDSKDIIPNAFDAGATDYLARPFDRSELMARVRNLLNLRKSTLQLEDDKRTLQQRIDQATKELKSSEQRFRLALEGTQDGIWDWDLETDSVFYSSNWCQMLGYKKEDVPNLPAFWMGRVHPDDHYLLTSAIDNHIRGETDVIDCEYRLKHKKGFDVWVHTKGKAVRNDRGTALRVVGAQSDITDLKEVQEQLAHNALHDTLTDLPNRSLFNERLNQAFLRYKRQESDKFTVLFIDLDKFKEINDTYGHSAGDKILKKVTDILNASTREVDTVARLGGDEFVILLEQTGTENEAKVFLDRLYEGAKIPVSLAGTDVKISLSIGVSTIDSKHSTYDSVLKEADTALYKAKEKGRGQAVFYKHDMGEASPRRRELIESMGTSLINDEIQIFYQPIVCLKTQKHLGYEALLRWQHPSMGLIDPEDFIPIAEKDDMILRLGAFVMNGAMAQLAKWQKQYNDPEMFMCINVTSAQVFQENFFDKLMKSCKDVGVKPEKIVLEFSEIGLSEIYKWNCSALKDIKETGFHIALDDYGEGRASVRSLVDYQMDFLKIDRSLSLELLDDDRKRRLFDLMIHLGSESNMEIVVEGIETPQILAYVQKSKANMGQGYLYSRPCPAIDIEALRAKVMQKTA